jgi:hypothetical protein
MIKWNNGYKAVDLRDSYYDLFGSAVNRNNLYFLIPFLHHYMFLPLQAKLLRL